VLEPVRAFYEGFRDNFAKPADYATEDWNHINPLGGRANGRDAVLKETREVHKTFLKDVTDKLTNADVRYASSDVAVVTAESETSPFALPGTSTPIVRRWIRTFVVVKRDDGWKIMQDHNTAISVP
jgi:uncharacterized protein (TIGR02246 family)